MTIEYDQAYDALLLVIAVFGVFGSIYQWLWKPYVKADEDRAQRIANEAAKVAVGPLLEQLTELHGEVRAIRSEVTTNGGKSLKDVVIATREGQQVLAARFDQHIHDSPHGEH